MIDLADYTPAVFDIETAGIYPELKDAPQEMASAWIRLNNRDAVPPAEAWGAKVALSPEFSRIVCISTVAGLPEKEVVSFHGEEKDLIRGFVEHFRKLFTRHDHPMILTGHNIGNFDIPFLTARMMVNEVPVPGFFRQVVEAKPWERKLFDTKDAWQFGGRKSIPFSLESACVALGIESPKNSGVEGAEVHAAFHAGRIDEIAKYCELDVLATLALAEKISEGWFLQ